MEDLMNRMKLEDHREINVDTETHDDLNQKILKCLSTCNLISRKKRTWFSSYQINELKVNLSKFPDHQVTIRKFLKIAKASFHRLKEEIKDLENHSIISKRTMRDNKDLKIFQKVYIYISDNWWNLLLFHWH